MLLSVAIIAAISHHCVSSYYNYPQWCEGLEVRTASIPGAVSVTNQVMRLDKHAQGALIGTTDAAVHRAVCGWTFGTGSEGPLISIYPYGRYTADLKNNPQSITNAETFFMLFGSYGEWGSTYLTRANLSYNTTRIDDKLRKDMADVVTRDSSSFTIDDCTAPVDDYWTGQQYGVLNGESFGANMILGWGTSKATHNQTAKSTRWYNRLGSLFPQSDIDFFYRGMGILFNFDNSPFGDRENITDAISTMSEVLNGYFDYNVDDVLDRLKLSGCVYGDQGLDIMESVASNRFTRMPTPEELDSRRIKLYPWAFCNTFLSIMDTVYVGPDALPKIKYDIVDEKHSCLGERYITATNRGFTVKLDLEKEELSLGTEEEPLWGVIEHTNIVSRSEPPSTNTTAIIQDRVIVNDGREKVEVKVGVKWRVDPEELAASVMEMAPRDIWMELYNARKSGGRFIIGVRSGSFNYEESAYFEKLVYTNAPGTIDVYIHKSCTTESIGVKDMKPYDMTLQSLDNMSSPCMYPHPAAMAIDDVGRIDLTVFESCNSTTNDTSEYETVYGFDPEWWSFRLVGDEYITTPGEVNARMIFNNNELKSVISERAKTVTGGASAIAMSGDDIARGAFAFDRVSSNNRLNALLQGPTKIDIDNGPVFPGQMMIRGDGSYCLGTNGVEVVTNLILVGYNFSLETNDVSVLRQMYKNGAAEGAARAFGAVKWNFKAMGQD